LASYWLRLCGARVDFAGGFGFVWRDFIAVPAPRRLTPFKKRRRAGERALDRGLAPAHRLDPLGPDVGWRVAAIMERRRVEMRGAVILGAAGLGVEQGRLDPL
jgi:hypothetical protein